MNLGRACVFAAAAAVLQGACGSAAAQTPPQSFSVWQAGIGTLAPSQSFASSVDIGLFHDLGSPIASAALTLEFVGSGRRATTPLGTTTVVTHSGDYITTDTTTLYDDPLDSVEIALFRRGGPSASADDAAGGYGTTSAPTSTTPVYVTYQVCQPSGPFGGTDCYDQSSLAGYSHTDDRTEGYQGAFSFTSALDAAALSELVSTGIARFGFTVLGGGVALGAAHLDFTTGPAVVAAVPEPTTTSLMLAGFASLAWMARRRRGRQRETPEIRRG